MYHGGILLGEIFPGGEVVFHLGLAHLDEVAVGGTEGIGGIELYVHVLGGDVEHALEHASHLLFGGGAVAGDGHLDFSWFVFGDGDVAHDGGCDGHPLGATEFEHGLYVLAVEGCFDGHFVGLVGVDDGGDALEDFAQTEVVALVFFQFYHAHGHEGGFVACHTQYAITHHVGAGIDSKDDFLYVGFLCGHCAVMRLCGCAVVRCWQKRKEDVRSAHPHV